MPTEDLIDLTSHIIKAYSEVIKVLSKRIDKAKEEADDFPSFAHTYTLNNLKKTLNHSISDTIEILEKESAFLNNEINNDDYTRFISEKETTCIVRQYDLEIEDETW
jgi:coenzyme F420-reducing hydrogenase alpha subunit